MNTRIEIDTTEREVPPPGYSEEDTPAEAEARRQDWLDLGGSDMHFFRIVMIADNHHAAIESARFHKDDDLSRQMARQEALGMVGPSISRFLQSRA